MSPSRSLPPLKRPFAAPPAAGSRVAPRPFAPVLQAARDGAASAPALSGPAELAGSGPGDPLTPSAEAAAAALPAAPAAPSPGEGRPLPGGLRAHMERAFRHDFSRVRVHPSGHLAPRLGAVALTRGADIHFAPGRYHPASLAGREVLAHELAHVVQQDRGRVAVPAGPGLPINDEPHLEGEAEAAAARAARGISVRLSGAGRAVLAPAAAPLQPLWGMVAGGTGLLRLKKTRGRRGRYRDSDTGDLYDEVPGSQVAHPASGKNYQQVRPVPPKAAKVKKKDKLASGYESGGASGSESDLDPADYTDEASEDEADWDVLDKDPGRDRFMTEAMDVESEHFGKSAPPADTSHHPLAGDLESGLRSGSTASPISLEGLSTTRYLRAMVKASTDAPPSTWGGTNRQPRQKLTMGDVEVSQQRKPTVNQPMNLQVASFEHYGSPKPGESGIYPSETVISDVQGAMGLDKAGMADRMGQVMSSGTSFKTSELTSGGDKVPRTRRMNALLHLGREEILRALGKAPAGISLSLGLELLKKDPKFAVRHLFGRSAKYGPMTPEGVAADPAKAKRRVLNLLRRYAKVKLRRNKALRKKVKAAGKAPKDVGRTYSLVPRRNWIEKKLKRTLGKK